MRRVAVLIIWASALTLILWFYQPIIKTTSVNDITLAFHHAAYRAVFVVSALVMLLIWVCKNIDYNWQYLLSSSIALLLVFFSMLLIRGVHIIEVVNLQLASSTVCMVSLFFMAADADKRVRLDT